MGWISNTQLISILEATQQVPEEILQELRKKNGNESLLETTGGLIPPSVQNHLQNLLKTLKQTFPEIQISTEKQRDIDSISLNEKKDIVFALQTIIENLCEVEDINKCFAELGSQPKKRIGQIMVKNRLLPGDRFVKISREIEKKITDENIDGLICENKNIRVMMKNSHITFVETSIPEQFGPYRIIGEVARGGMGVVYKAWDEKLRRTIALKVLKAWESPSLKDIQRFRREARLAASLNHPNIVNIYETDSVDGVHYFTMDFVEGETLSVTSAMTSSESLAIIREMALALDYAHNKGVVHRDVKPGNIILDKNKCPLLTDFGLAKGLNTESFCLTKSSDTIGTPAYMSPEQVEGRSNIDGRSDIYALGAVLYEMLTGKPPFEGESLGTIFNSVLTKEPIRPSKINSKVSPAVEAIWLKAMAKDREQRYATAKEMAHDIDLYLTGESKKSNHIVLLHTIQNFLREKNTIVPALAILGIFLLIYLVIPWFISMRENSAATEVYQKGIKLLDKGKHLEGLFLIHKSMSASGLREKAKDLLEKKSEKFIDQGKSNLRSYKGRKKRFKEASHKLKINLQTAKTLKGKAVFFDALEKLKCIEVNNLKTLLKAAKYLHLAQIFSPFSNSNKQAKKTLSNIHLQRFLDAQEKRNGDFWNYLLAKYYQQKQIPLSALGGQLSVLCKNSNAKAYLFTYHHMFYRHIAVPWKVSQQWQKELWGSLEKSNADTYLAQRKKYLAPKPKTGKESFWNLKQTQTLFANKYLLVVKTPDFMDISIPLNIQPGKKYKINIPLQKETEWSKNFSLVRFKNEYCFIAKKEVTVAEYQKFINSPRIMRMRVRSKLVPQANGKKLWKQTAKKWFPINPNLQLPVVGVSWDSARLYCVWLTKKHKSGMKFTLLSEEKWEWVAGAVHDLSYPWGNQFDICFTNGNSKQVKPGGSFSYDMSVFGIYDMAGNVREWCQNGSGKQKTPIIKGGSRYFQQKRYFSISHSNTTKKNFTAADLGFRIMAQKRPKKEND